MAVCLKAVYLGVQAGAVVSNAAYETNAAGVAVTGAPVQVLMVDASVSDFTTCTYVVQSGVEVANNPFAITAEEGALLSAGVIACWMTAYGVRTIINIVKGSTEA